MKTENKKADDLSLREHFLELRMRVIISVAIVLVFFSLLLYFSDPLIAFITGPMGETGRDLHFIKVHEAFYSTVKAALAAGVILAAPLWIWILLGFLLPAFDKSMKALIVVLLVISSLFVAGGFFFSYKILLPYALTFLLNFGGDKYESMISLEYYLSFFLRLFMASGLGFQLPLVMLFLNRTGVADRKLLTSLRKYAIIGILFLSALITPPDVISQLMLSLPLYLLYELGILFCIIFGRRKRVIGEEIHG